MNPLSNEGYSHVSRVTDIEEVKAHVAKANREERRRLIANGDYSREEVVEALESLRLEGVPRKGGMANRTIMVPTDKIGDPEHPTAAELDEHGIDITASIVADGPLIHADKPTTPDRVEWAEVRAATPEWPRNWHGRGNPIPVPGGALVLVTMPSRAAQRDVTTVMSWSVDGKLAVVKVGNQPAIYATVRDARIAVQDMAVRLGRA